MVSQNKLNKVLKSKFNAIEKQRLYSNKKSSISSVSKNTIKTLEAPMLIEVKLPGGMVFSTSFQLTCFLSLLKDLSTVLNNPKHTKYL